MVRPQIHFAVTLTLNLWQWFPHFFPWKRDLQNYLPILIHRMVRPHIHFAVTLTLNLWQWFPRFSPWKRDLFPNSITTLSLVASQPVMSLRPLNWQTAKSQFRACWHLQKTSITNLELGSVSIGYVIATSEPADLSLIHIWRCRRSTLCRSRWSPYH